MPTAETPNGPPRSRLVACATTCSATVKAVAKATLWACYAAASALAINPAWGDWRPFLAAAVALTVAAVGLGGRGGK